MSRNATGCRSRVDDADPTESLQESYDRVASEYTEKIANELDGKPFDRALLDRFADEVRGKGPVCDVGCGPGHITNYLHERGIDEVFGLDLSPGMIKEARRRYPGLSFVTGDLRSLDLVRGGMAGIVAFYSIIHLRPEEVRPALQGLRRVLQANGSLLLAVHLGDSVVHLDSWFGEDVSLDFTFFQADTLRQDLLESEFDIQEITERAPYPEVEVATRRLYVWAVATEQATSN